MIKYTKTETIGEMQASESVEFETFDQLLDYLRKDDVVNVAAVDFSEHQGESGTIDSQQERSFIKTGDSRKQKDLLDDGDFLG